MKLPQPEGRMRAFLGHALSDELSPKGVAQTLHRERRCRVLLLALDVEIGGQATHLWADANEWIATESPTLTDQIQPCFGHLNDDTGSLDRRELITVLLTCRSKQNLSCPQLKNPGAKSFCITPVLNPNKASFLVGMSAQSHTCRITQVHQGDPTGTFLPRYLPEMRRVRCHTVPPALDFSRTSKDLPGNGGHSVPSIRRCNAQLISQPRSTT